LDSLWVLLRTGSHAAHIIENDTSADIRIDDPFLENTRCYMRMASTIMFVSFMVGANVGSAREACPLNSNVEISTRILVQAPGVYDKALKGRVVECDEDSLALSPDLKDALREISYEEIETLKVYRGERRAAREGALIGSVSMGLIFGLIASSNYCMVDQCEPPTFEDGVQGALAGVIVGGLLGSAIGNGIRRDRWERVDIQVPQVQVTALGRNKGVGLALSVRF
jgi:hypothetical protein